MHELSACCLAAVLREGGRHSWLALGVGTGQEIVTIGALEPDWRFTAVDPSPAMITLARDRFGCLGLLDRTELVEGGIETLAETPHDGAILIGVLHHLGDTATRIALLTAIARRLKPRAPLILGGNYRSYDSEPLLRAAWRQRWRQQGTPAETADAQFAKIPAGVVPPDSEEEVFRLLAEAGFAQTTRFFNSLFWGGWVAFSAD